MSKRASNRPGGATAPRRSVDRDGVVKVEVARYRGRRLWPLALAVPAIVGLAFLLATGRRASPAKPLSPAAVTTVAPAMVPEPPRPAMANADPPTARELEPDGGAAADEPPAPPPRPREGVFAFPAPGTKRIKAGLVVPDGFELPPGFVRHYQTTDKGEMLQAILMFHPDYQPIDAGGRPVELPADRVVPPEMAPPGLALQTLEVPADAYADPEKERAEAGL